MVILHIHWVDGKLVLWAEQAADVAQPLVGDLPQLSPYTVREQGLAEMFQSLTWEEDLVGTTQVVWLPTMATAQGSLPLPTQPIFAPPQYRQATAMAAQIKPWWVQALILSWRQAFTLFGLCQERCLAEGVFAGNALLEVVHLFRYAGSLVARGKFLPALRATHTGFEAYWRPAMDDAETRRCQALAARLPPIFVWGQAREMVAELLEEMLDNLVRFSVTTTLSRSHAEKGSFYSVHDAWFAALRGAKREVRWTKRAELRELQDELRQWQQPIENTALAGFTLLFELSEPVTAQQPWPLKTFICYKDREYPFPPTLSSDPGAVAPQLPFELRETHLRALGQASLLCNTLTQMQSLATGLQALLTAEQAHAFMKTVAPLLEGAGYRVRLPAWWQDEEARNITLELTVAALTEVCDDELSLEHALKLAWHASLDGVAVEASELEELLAHEGPLHFFRGRWIQLNTKQLQDALRLMQRKSELQRPAHEVLHLALGGADHAGLKVRDIHGTGWFQDFLARLRGDQPFSVLPQPSAFCGAMRPYQLRGYSWLVFLRQWGLGACLADDMGLGKTIQALALLLHEQARGVTRPTLLVAPMSILGNWQREVQRFAPSLRCWLHHGAQRLHAEEFVKKVQTHDIVLTSYHLLYRDYRDLRCVTWGGLILDEAQNIKNPDTHQSQAARALAADFRVVLTGTPMENHVGDLWSIMDFLNPGLLGKRTVFRKDFYLPIQSAGDRGARARLRRLTAPFMLRRLKTDQQIIADLPQKIEAKVYCHLTREQVELYSEVLAEFRRELAESSGQSRRGLILGVLTRLKQVCNHPAHYLGEAAATAQRSGKLRRLEELLGNIFRQQESVLIFTQYAKMGALLQRRLSEVFARDIPFLHGAVKRQERERLIQEFQASSMPTAFVLSLKAGGTGLNLTQASHVVHFDRWWNPAVEDQATDRAYRLGQTRDVMVHKFICGGTLEDRIDAMQLSKSALADEIVQSGEAFLTELSDDELQQVLELAEVIIDDDE